MLRKNKKQDLQQFTYNELIIIHATLQYLYSISDWKTHVDDFNMFMKRKGIWFDPHLNFINVFGKTVIGTIIAH